MMPYYSYTDGHGHTVEQHYPMGCAPDVLRISGRVYRRDIVADHAGVRAAAGNWPMESEAMGVLPEQVAEAAEEAAKHGVPTDFNPETGAAIFRDRTHRRKYCRLYGVHDRDGGYSDP